MHDQRAKTDIDRLVERFIAGDDDALGEYLARENPRLLRQAGRRIRLLRIDEADLDAEGALDVALANLCEARKRGSLATIKSEDELGASCP